MRKRGRPLKNEKACLVLPPIRVTKSQSDMYRKAAEIQGKNLSSWLKDIADKEAKVILGKQIYESA